MTTADAADERRDVAPIPGWDLYVGPRPDIPDTPQPPAAGGSRALHTLPARSSDAAIIRVASASGSRRGTVPNVVAR